MGPGTGRSPGTAPRGRERTSRSRSWLHLEITEVVVVVPMRAITIGLLIIGVFVEIHLRLAVIHGEAGIEDSHLPAPGGAVSIGHHHVPLVEVGLDAPRGRHRL